MKKLVIPAFVIALVGGAATVIAMIRRRMERLY